MFYFLRLFKKMWAIFTLLLFYFIFWMWGIFKIFRELITICYYCSAAHWSRDWELLNVNGSEEAKPFLFTHSVVSDALWPHELQDTRLPCPPLSPRVCFTNKETEASPVFLPFFRLCRWVFAPGGHSEILFTKNWPPGCFETVWNRHGTWSLSARIWRQSSGLGLTPLWSCEMDVIYCFMTFSELVAILAFAQLCYRC